MRYSAFISYNHRDRREAGWLHRALETYRVPQRMRGQASRVGPLGAKLPPVFRDREELSASADLAQSVKAALEEAASLIVICSPNGAKSRWVNEEIRAFTAMGRRDRIQCLIIAGQPNASRTPGMDPEEECLPPALFEDGGQEPLAADIRPGGDGRSIARLKLLAGILGVPYDELRQREQARRMRQLAMASAVLGLAFVVMTGLAVTAYLARNEAIRQRDIARQKTITAERTVDFVKSLFETSDPSQSKGATITAREILDRGAKRIDQSLTDEPSVRAELATTLGEVYGGLGLFEQGQGIIRRNLALQGVAPGSRARQYVALGEALSRASQYDDAIHSFRTALSFAQDPRNGYPDLIARIWDGIGEAESGANAFDAADRDIRKAVEMDTARLGLSDPAVARDLEALGVNEMYAGRLSPSRTHIEQALTIRMHTQGQLHPKVAEDLMNLGSIAYLQHDAAASEGYFRKALTAARTVLGPDHPEVAGLEINLGRVLIERRQFAAARPMLEHAVAILVRERGETHDDVAFEADNLAIARRGVGELAGAEQGFRMALRAAQLHRSRNEGPVLTDLAEVRCARGAVAEGLSLLDRAAPIMAKAYPDDPWRSAWVRVVRARCRFNGGDRRGAREALAEGAPVIRQRWPADSLYGAVTAELAQRVGG